MVRGVAVTQDASHARQVPLTIQLSFGTCTADLNLIFCAAISVVSVVWRFYRCISFLRSPESFSGSVTLLADW